MSTKEELRDQIGRLSEGYKEWRDTALDLGRDLDEARATIRDLSDQLAARDAATTAPRQFRVGDRVRVAEGATWNALDKSVHPSSMAGFEGVVTDQATDGDLYVAARVGGVGEWCDPRYCTLIEPDSTAAPAGRFVRVAYMDGTGAEFDADAIAGLDGVPVYGILKGGRLVACVPIMEVRSIAVVSQ